jgi:phosphate butyryltransferase
VARIRSMKELVERARARGPVRLVVPAAESETALAAATEAERQGLALPILVGDRARVTTMLRGRGHEARRFVLIHEPDDAAAVRMAVHLARIGEADVILKGRCRTGELLRAVLDRETGLRRGSLVSDVMVTEDPLGGPRLLALSDGGVNVAPTLGQKRAILDNALRTLRRLGVERPKVAALCAIETVEKGMPHTGEARALAEQAERGEIPDCDLLGPVALDGALSLEAARAKHLDHPVAGQADLLLVPTIEVGNTLGKAFTWLARKPVGHVIEGARAPVLIPSRAEHALDKLCSIALGVLSALEEP